MTPMERIVVAIKQVPDTMEVRIDPETNRIIRQGVPSIINPYDLYALETALRLKEAHGAEVVVCTMGPPQAESALREALALGCDRPVLLSDVAFAGSDTLATAYTLSLAVARLAPVDMVVCGREALDGSTGQVGPELAENLGWPFFSFVSGIESLGDGRLKVRRMMEDHYEEISGSLPAVLTVVKEIAEPRLPSLRGMLKSKKADIPTWTAADLGGDPARLGADGSPTWVTRVWTPEHESGRGVIFDGEPAEAARDLVNALKRDKHL